MPLMEGGKYDDDRLDLEEQNTTGSTVGPPLLLRYRARPACCTVSVRAEDYDEGF